MPRLQEHLPFTVCAEGCEAAEEQSDDKVRTSQVPERSEDKTKVIWQWCLPFTVLKPCKYMGNPINLHLSLQQHLPFAVCAEGGEAAEEKSDDEVRTSQVPEQSEGKTNLMR